MSERRTETVAAVRRPHDGESAGAPLRDGRASTLMRAVNMHMRSLATGVCEPESVAFFCECRLPTCFTVLWLSNRQFDAAVEAEEWIVAAGHQPSIPYRTQNRAAPAGSYS